MKQLNFPVWSLLLFILITASSCDLVEGIFKAGFWTAIILIVLIIGVVMWIIGKTRRK